MDDVVKGPKHNRLGSARELVIVWTFLGLLVLAFLVWV